MALPRSEGRRAPGKLAQSRRQYAKPGLQLTRCADCRREAAEPQMRGAPGMSECITYVGIDAHKATNQVALVMALTGEIKEKSFGTAPTDVARMARWMAREGAGRVACCYEAGPCGYGLQRQLTELGITCQVVAPSLVWTQPGERRKNDRRDARKLALQLAAGQLTEVQPPTPAEEALRELVRDREDAQMAAKRLKQQVGAMLLSAGERSLAKPWTLAYRAWLRQLRLAEVDAQYVLEDRLLALAQAEQRVQALDERIAAAAEREEHRDAVGRLRCFRGIDTLAAMIVLAELYHFGRFGSPRALMAYLGLIPGERSSGQRERSTGLTKTGNGSVRRVLIEAAHHYRLRPELGKTLRRRQEGQPQGAVSMAQTALRRLHRKYWRLVNAGKHHNVATAAVARELVGCLWAVLQDSPAAA